MTEITIPLPEPTPGTAVIEMLALVAIDAGGPDPSALAVTEVMIAPALMLGTGVLPTLVAGGAVAV